ncbi:NAD-dependent epimerase/dehydratase family protein [Candidatus Latescibacterota bacterium]
MKRTVLILGGAGFIGSNCAERFVDEGWNVIIVDGLLTDTGGSIENVKHLLPQITFIEESVQTASGLIEIIDKSDLIIDSMAWTLHHKAIDNPDYDLLLNVSSHVSLIKMLKQCPGKNVIYLGTRGQYGNPGVDVIVEDTPMLPQDIQGINKLAGESYFRFYAKQYKLNVASLRIANCFGKNQLTEGDDIGLVGSFIRDAMNDKLVEIYGSNRKRPLIYVNDLIDIIYRMSERSFEGFSCYNINAWNMLIQDMAEIIIKITGKGSFSVRELPEHIRNMDVGVADFDSSKITSVLGDLKFTPYEKAIEQTLKYFKNKTG